MQFDVHILIVLAIVLGFIVLDWVCGVLRAVATHTFSLQKLPGQLETFVLPLFLPLLGLALVAFLAPLANVVGATGGSDATFYAAAGAVVIKAFADIIDKLSGFGVGVPAPATTVPPAA